MLVDYTSCAIGAYAYNTENLLREPEHQAKELFITNLYHSRPVKRMFVFSSEEQVGTGIEILIHKSFTQIDIEVEVFRNNLPMLKLPSRLLKHDLRTRLETNQYDLEDLQTAHRILFLDSDYGKENFYSLKLESEFERDLRCPLCRDYHKDHCEFDINKIKDGALYNDFINILANKYNPEIRVEWVQSGEYDLSLIDSPNKTKIGSARKTGTIQLEDCLNAFREEEMLQGDNKWYCGKCKDHVEALKKMDVYRLPNILVIQLKRFIKKETNHSLFRETSQKINDLVNFKLEDLDMAPYLLSKDGVTNEDCKYDLYGVSHHSGSLSGGHYTASCKNQVDGKWYYFNDSRVSKISSGEVVDKSVYLLFYKRRTPAKPLDQ